MARRKLPKPVRFLLFGTLGLLLALFAALAVWASLLPPEGPEPFIVDPRVWYRASADEPIEIEGNTFILPIDCQYARLDASYGPDLDAALIIREDPKSPYQLVVGRTSRLTPDTTIEYDRIGRAFLEFARETREWGEDTRLVAFEADEPEFFPDRHAGFHLPADLYFFDDGLLRNRDRVRAVLESVAVTTP